MTGRRDTRSGEHGVALIWAILLMVIVAGLVTTFTMVAQRSTERSSDAARRVANAATVQTAVTRVLYGFQNNLGTEQDFYTLDNGDLQQIVGAAGGLARVYSVNQLNGLPSQYRTTYGVWEHDVNGNDQHVLVPVTGYTVPTDVVEETFSADSRACVSAGLPQSACAPGAVRAYWQVVRVVMPDITGRDNPNVVLVVRSWLGNRQAGAYSRASYARVEMRPGRFADFQLISDGNLRFGSGATINGPVHSNGLSSGSFSTVHTAPNRSADDSWIYLENGVSCRGQALLTITQGDIFGRVPRGCNAQRANGQTISFLRAVESMDYIAASRGRRGVVIFNSRGREGREAGRDPYDTSYTVRLSGNDAQIHNPDGSFERTVPLGRVNAFLFDDDVRVRGQVGAERRLTIAARRDGEAAATIHIDGNITKGNQESTSIGLIAEGEIVLWQTQANPCMVTRVEAAMVAATGGVTVPRKYTTDIVQDDAPVCRQPVTLDGSVAAHRPPTLVWSWPPFNGQGPWFAGYRDTRNYSWDSQLQRVPPPYFPLTGTWQPFNVREANSDCIFDTALRRDPECR